MSQLFATLVDGVMYSAWLFLIALGLTLIYGVMKILNMAHGSFYTIGAYTAVTFVSQWLTLDTMPGFSYILLILAAIVSGVILGVLVECGVLRFFYKEDPVVALLITYSIFLILEDVVKIIWGVDTYVVNEPYQWMGNFSIESMYYSNSNYNFLTIGAAIFCGLAVALFLRFARPGRLLRAVIHDREVSLALGINVQKYFLYTFVVGASFAALGGALTAPTISVAPGIGVDVIILAFAVVVIGGLGSLSGAALGALIVGFVRSFAVHYFPEVELFSIYLVMAMVLIFRPKGLFAPVEARKI